MRARLLTLGFLLLTALLSAPAPAQTASPVADLNTVHEDLAQPLFVGRDFVSVGSLLFFVHDDGVHGIELWKSDGTAAGTALVQDVCPGACASVPSSLTAFQGALYFLAQEDVHGRELWRTDGAGATLVTDLLPGTGNGALAITAAANLLFLSGDDGIHGSELWKTDGTAAGTVLVADLFPGPSGSRPRLYRDVGIGRLLLNADDGVHGREPWLSDGTGAGTVLLKDIQPGLADSSTADPQSFLERDVEALGAGAFLFQADDGLHGAEPWISNGTGAGTALLADVNPGAGSSYPLGFTALGGSVFFAAYEDADAWELWATDGTGAGTRLVKNIHPTASSDPRQLTPFGGKLYFEAGDANGRELWSTDGTEAGTTLVKDINPGTGDAFSPFLRPVLRASATSLYFFADDGVHGQEPWISDGTGAGTHLIRDVAPGAAPGTLAGYAGLTLAGSTAYFQGYTDAHGLELWKSDGTEAGTVEVKNAATVKSGLATLGGYLSSTFGRLGSHFVFDGDDGVSGVEPWATDGTAPSTVQLADLSPGADWGGPTERFPAAGLFYGQNIGDLWKSDGTPAGTSPLLPLGTLRAESPLVPLGAFSYFVGNDAAGGSELWKTNGTAAGTQRVRDLFPGGNSGVGAAPTVFGSLLLFSGNDGVGGPELWKSDGTGAGTTLVKDLSASPYGGSPAEFRPLGARVLFSANASSPSQRDLWVTDGTPAGTTLLKANSSGLVSLGSTVLFLGSDAATGRELWKSDGTPAGTTLVKDIQVGPGAAFNTPYFSEESAVVGTTFFFVADDGVNGAELWKTNGTPAGTVLVKDVFPGARSSEIAWMTHVRSRLFFVADDGTHGRELWASDGTASGTRLVKDIVPGPGSPHAQHLAALGHVVLFNATDGLSGIEPWKSDGTEAGTTLLQDIAPGAASSSAVGFTSAFPTVYFAANDNVSGFELWSFPRAVLGSTFSDVPPTYWAWQYVESLAEAGLTGGCGNGLYCPARPVTRAETAVFLLRSLHGTTYTPPPATGTRFADVPLTHWAAAWIEQFAAEGFTSGCGNSNFCPDTSTQRDQMAVLLLRTLHGTAYTPPPATGTRFDDVPASHPAAAWIEQLAAEGLTSGCGNNNFCPTSPVNRDQMAVFLVQAFHLPLP